MTVLKHYPVIAAALLAAWLAHGATVEWVCSTEDNPWRQMPEPSLTDTDAPAVVFVKPGRTCQTIDGFGGSFNELGWVALGKASKKDAQEAIKALFGDEGCAFTLARIPIGASDFALDYYSLDDTPDDYELKHFSIERDRRHLLPYIKAATAVRPDLRCWASPWTPPEWMKTNKHYSAGSLRWEPEILETYANYFIKWIRAYQSEGVNLYAVSPQNEPNIDNPYTTCLWTGEQLREFLADHLGPKLDKHCAGIELWVGFNGDPIHGGENVNDRLITVMEDPKAHALIDGIGFQYDSRNQTAVAHELYPGKKLIQTESVCFNGDNSWGQAMELYGLMKRYFEGGANQYFAWNMILDETGKSSWDWAQNALITVDQKTGKATYNGEFHVYKHFSHFVKPGAKRILATGTWGDRIAFVNPDGSIVVVMANSSGSDCAATIAFDDLGRKDTIEITVPARSVNTFVVSP
jgi:glucosylceramidase